jgi:predicted transposase YbfD/YdcC
LGASFAYWTQRFLSNAYRRWIQGIAGYVKGVIALDGKTSCGSRDGANTALHMVSAFATQSGLCLGQESTRGKGHEIVAIKALLEALTLKDCTVTIDAVGCQKEIAEKIIEQGGNYLLAVKANQGTLFEAVAQFYAKGQRHGFGSLALSRFETLEKDHRRIETRRHVWVSKLDWMEPSLRGDWKNLAGVGMVERPREIKGKVSVERTFYIGSKGVSSAQALAEATRGHRGVENRLHWVLDVTFREDECRLRTGHAPRNPSTIRKFALTLLRQDQQYPKRSLRSRRKTADRLANYRESLLGLQVRE